MSGFCAISQHFTFSGPQIASCQQVNKAIDMTALHFQTFFLRYSKINQISLSPPQAYIALFKPLLQSFYPISKFDRNAMHLVAVVRHGFYQCGNKAYKLKSFGKKCYEFFSICVVKIVMIRCFKKSLEKLMANDLSRKAHSFATLWVVTAKHFDFCVSINLKRGKDKN